MLPTALAFYEHASESTVSASAPEVGSSVSFLRARLVIKTFTAQTPAYELDGCLFLGGQRSRRRPAFPSVHLPSPPPQEN